ncbi:MAG: PKD domain-containing protein [Anaerolineae bacterium]
MSVDVRMSRAWLFWAGLFLVATLGVFLLSTGPQASQALAPLEGVTVHKEADVQSVLPGGFPIYTVVFSNTNATDVILDSITDILPAGFEVYVMVAGSDVGEMPSPTSGTVVWEGPHTIPAEGTLTLRYLVKVDETVSRDVMPYRNEVMAVAEDSSTVGPASAPLIVGDVALSLSKEASAPQVVYGQAVTYTVTIANSGEVTGTVDAITDTPDVGLTYDGWVAGSDIEADPANPVPGEPLVWNGPWDVAPGASLVLKYRATTPAGDQGQITLCNEVAVGGADAPAAEQVCVGVRPEQSYAYLPLIVHDFQSAYFVVTKTASVESLDTSPGQTLDYTVTIVNPGDTTGILTEVKDVLPAGFAYDSMVQGDAPGVNGQILTWTGNWPVAPGAQRQFVYRVTAPTETGTYINRVDVLGESAVVPTEPAEATVSIEEPIAGLTASNDGPTKQGDATTLSAQVTAGTNVVYTWDFGDSSGDSGQVVTHVYPAVGEYTATVTAHNGVSQETATTTVTIEPAVLLHEDFENGWDRWTEFLNYSYRLAPGQWYWDSNDGVDGSAAVTQNAYAVADKEAEDALLMYLQPGSESWTDYRVEAKMILRTDNYPHGLWVRGQYQDVGEADPAGWVTGYYVMVGGNKTASTHYVSLKQMQTETDCWDQACNNPQNLYDFNNPHEIAFEKKDGALSRNVWHTIEVEVVGANIKIWLDGVLYIDHTDTKEPFLTGTIGLKTFKANTVSFDDILVTPLD